jgi:hypothetical protein
MDRAAELHVHDATHCYALCVSVSVAVCVERWQSALYRARHVGLTLISLSLSAVCGEQGGQKLERARDLFEQALTHCPVDLARPLYLLYARLEEEHGLAKNAMRVYDRATRGVAPEEQFEMYLLYASKVAETYGVTHTRPIYERAIEALPDAVRPCPRSIGTRSCVCVCVLVCRHDPATLPHRHPLLSLSVCAYMQLYACLSLFLFVWFSWIWGAWL